MKRIVLVLGVVMVFFAAPYIFAQHEHEGHQHGMVEEEYAGAVEEQEEAALEEGPIEVGNKICPVSSQEIKEEEAYKFEYEGKIYNLCCKMCVKDFEKDPQKYIEKLEEMEPEHEHHHEGHHDHGEHHE